METLANFDYDQFRDTYADIKFLEGKRSANTTTSNKVSLFYAKKFKLYVLKTLFLD
jgi:hypothetical protein